MYHNHERRLTTHKAAETLELYFKKLLSQLPPGQDPFEFALKKIAAKFSENFSKATSIILGAFFGFHMVISASCLLILLLPFLKGGRDRRWIIRKLYIADVPGHKFDSRPLYFINSGMAMALFQLLGSVSSQVYIWVLVQRNKNHSLSAKAPIFSILGIMYEFEFLTYWAMAWALWAWLYSGRSYSIGIKKDLNRVISPSIFNFLFLAFPILGTFLNLMSIYLMDRSSERETSGLNDILRGLRLLSETWKKVQNSSNQLYVSMLHKNLTEETLRFEASKKELLNRTTEMIKVFRLMAAAWAFIMFITSLMFVYALGNLLVLFLKNNDQSRLLSSEGQNLNSSRQTNSQLEETPSLQGQRTTEHQNIEMERNLYNLAFRGTMAILGILSTISICVLSIFHAETIMFIKSWRSIMIWVSLVSGALVALPVTFQCWKMYRDKGELTGESLVEDSEYENQIRSKVNGVLNCSGTDSENIVLQISVRESERFL